MEKYGAAGQLLYAELCLLHKLSFVGSINILTSVRIHGFQELVRETTLKALNIGARIECMSAPTSKAHSKKE